MRLSTKAMADKSMASIQLVFVVSGYQKKTIRRLQADGVDIRISTKNAVQYTEARELINECISMAPLGGVFNLAMVKHYYGRHFVTKNNCLVKNIRCFQFPVVDRSRLQDSLLF